MTTTDIGDAKALTATQVRLIAKHANLNRQLTPEVLKDLDPTGINLIKIRLPRDLDDWPYRADTPIGPWKVSPCCGAFVEWSAADGSGAGGDLLTCKRCYLPVPDDFRDEPPRLAPEPPRPPSDWEPLPTVKQMAAIVEAVARP